MSIMRAKWSELKRLWEGKPITIEYREPPINGVFRGLVKKVGTREVTLLRLTDQRTFTIPTELFGELDAFGKIQSHVLRRRTIAKPPKKHR